MQRLRNNALIARWVLVWFALYVGAAIASPLIKPPSMQMVCSGAGGMKLVVTDDTGGEASTGLHLDCPLCMPAMGGPTSVQLPHIPSQKPCAPETAPALPAPQAFLGLPPPSRAPPVLS